MQPESIIEQAKQAWIEGNPGAFSSLFCTNGEFIVPGNRWVGRDDIHKAIADFSETHSGVKIEITNLVIQGDRAILEWSWEDRVIETGCRNKADDAIAVDFKNGKISRWREYIDEQ
ncbi:MAG: SgcJ/EcaC family oxidoreductase [Cyanobacteriota bacterium]|nr:SgcJ/EcaC family oxidoreductase [Cyanobacteriota bacterium]